MGWKDWVYGDLVSAADFQSLVQDQTVQRYASSSARSAALGSAVAEGMVSYLDDTNAVEVYNGSAWTGLSNGSTNAIINGAFDIWQRGTSFTNPGLFNYTADRFTVYNDGSGGTRTVSRQTFTPGTAPVAGYENAYFFRYAESSATSGATFNVIDQRIEDVRTLAGQTATFSFWAKADASRSLDVYFEQNFGSGGSTTVTGSTTSFSLTTSWQRFSVVMSIPSISGKTIGTSSFLEIRFSLPKNVIQTIDIWGIQLEAGSSATAFKRNSPSIQGELAACQRYYEKSYDTATAPATATYTGVVDKYIGVNVTGSGDQFYYRTTKRSNPTVTIYSPQTGTSARIRSNSLGSDLTITGGSNGVNGYSFYWSQSSAGLNVSYHWVAESEL